MFPPLYRSSDYVLSFDCERRDGEVEQSSRLTLPMGQKPPQKKKSQKAANRQEKKKWWGLFCHLSPPDPPPRFPLCLSLFSVCGCSPPNLLALHTETARCRVTDSFVHSPLTQPASLPVRWGNPRDGRETASSLWRDRASSGYPKCPRCRVVAHDRLTGWMSSYPAMTKRGELTRERPQRQWGRE